MSFKKFILQRYLSMSSQLLLTKSLIVKRARLAGVEDFAPSAGPATAGEKSGQVESMKPENTSQSSSLPVFQSSQYSQTHCTDSVSRRLL